MFVLSPDFCNSEWVEVERTSSIADNPKALKRKVRPLMLRPCRDLPTFPRFLRQVQTVDVSTTALFEEHYPRICRDLGGVPREDMTAADRSKLPPVYPLPERHRMPYHSLGDKFVGRVSAIWDLSLLPGRAAWAKPSLPSNMPTASALCTPGACTGWRPTWALLQ